MQSWIYGRVGEEPELRGWDVLIINDNGKVKELYAMIDGASTHPPPA